MIPVRAIEKSIKEFLPDGRIIKGPRVPDRYRFDALRPYRPYPKLRKRGYIPSVLVRPQSTEEVLHIVRVARKLRAPLVPYGAGTGLMGAAIAVRGGIMVDTSLMNQIESVSSDDMFVKAQSGAVLEDIFNRLDGEGLLFAHDPWTRPVATLGGAISTNSLGYLGAKYGSVGNQLMSVEAVTAAGNVITTRPAQFASTGFDLKRLFIGTEGMFGFVARAVVRAFPKPERFALASYTFPDFEHGFRAISAIRKADVRPSMVDFGSEYAVSDAQLNLAFDGLREEVEAHLSRADELVKNAGGQRLSDRDAQEFWDERHAIALMYKRRVSKSPPEEPKTKYDYIHVSLPASKVLEFHREVLRLAASHRATLLEVGLWHGPELVSVVLSARASKPEFASRRLWQASNAIIECAQDLGGAMEFCHGVGLKLAHLMQREHGAGLELMRRIKHAIDPLGIMNPGKESL